MAKQAIERAFPLWIYITLTCNYYIKSMKRGRHYQYYQQYKVSGFTLIELSIVLVIIGLIVGGVLAGKELIESATLRRQVSQFERIASAANLFKVKYNAVAGDNLRNKNGIIEDMNGAWIDDGSGMHEQSLEPLLFMGQLVGDNLIESNFICAPGTLYGVPYGNYASVINPRASFLGVTHAGATWLLFMTEFPTACSINFIGGYAAGVVTPSQALSLDQKMDDGVPKSGNFYAVKIDGLWNVQGIADTTASSCVTDATATAYYVSNAAKACKLMIKLQ